MVLNAKLRNRRLATPCTNYGTVRENMESGVLFVGYDFSSALRIARKYFWRDSRTEKDIIHLMIKYVHAVKEELRQFSRPLRGIGAVHFAFR